MANNQKKSITPKGVNIGIKEGLQPDDFSGRVICKKCGKDIKFTLGSELFTKCPRCGSKVERDLKAETKESKKIIKYDILRRSKKYLLQIGFVITCIALSYNIVGFFLKWFTNGQWWLALMSLPFVAIAYICMRITRFKSASKKYRFFAWLALGVNCLALIAVIITAVPYLNDKLLDLYNS